MTRQLKDFDWDEVRDALEALLADLEENEPHAKNTIREIQNVLASIPDASEFE